MSNRLDTERQAELTPKRHEWAKQQLAKSGMVITFDNGKELQFDFKGSNVRFFSFTGWHTGKSIKDGRGIATLIKQLKP